MSRFKLSDVSGKYGAPMGRAASLPEDTNSFLSLRLKKLKWVDGDYDSGGAYWGGGLGDFIFCAYNLHEGVEVFVRAKSHKHAEEKVLTILPNAGFIGVRKEKVQWACLERFELALPDQCVIDCSHSGDCGADVEFWAKKITRPPGATPEAVAAECEDTGGWEDSELQDDQINWERVIWIAAGNIKDGMYETSKT